MFCHGESKYPHSPLSLFQSRNGYIYLLSRIQLRLKPPPKASDLPGSHPTNLSNPEILNPHLAYPPCKPLYMNCWSTIPWDAPKPGISQVIITAYCPKILAFAGNDTSIVAGQPLQLKGSGAPAFLWTPSFALNRSDIPDPVAILNQNQTYVMKTFTEEGCFAYDTINIKVFTTQPDIFVPNAFTPAGPANNIFRPIPVGISKLEYFRIYNRSGMLVYSTSQMGKGWDGNLNGTPQDTGGYVWMICRGNGLYWQAGYKKWNHGPCPLIFFQQ